MALGILEVIPKRESFGRMRVSARLSGILNPIDREEGFDVFLSGEEVQHMDDRTRARNSGGRGEVPITMRWSKKVG